MKLFSIGPVEMHPYTKRLGSESIPYFRTEEFSQTVLGCATMLSACVNAQDDARVFLLTASGTAAMETAVASAFTPGDRVLVMNAGTFGKRFCDICDVHAIPYVSVDLAFGESLTEERLAAYDGKGITGVLVNLTETSTGLMFDAPMIADFCRRNGALFVVDAIGAFLADALDISAMGIDIGIVSSQKGLALPPGLSMITTTDKAYRDRIAHAPRKSLYFHLPDYEADGRRGQTPYTPCVGIILQLEQRLQHIQEEGPDAVIAHTAALARQFRKGILELGYTLPPHPLSNALTPVLCPKNDAPARIRALCALGYQTTPCGGSLSESMLRVGHLGCLTAKDHADLLEAFLQIEA